MNWHLVIVFFFLDGTSGYLDGWFPREQPSYEVCEQRREYMDAAVKRADLEAFGIESYLIQCKEM